MARETEELLIALRADLNQFEKAFAKANGITVSQMRKIQRQAEQSATKVESAFNRLGSGIKNQLGPALSGVLAAVSFTAIIAEITEIIKKFGELKDEADRAGVSAEILQEINLAGIGSGAKDMVTNLQKFNLEIGEAATKGGELAALLEANNVPLRDANGQIRSTIDLFFDYIDLIKNARTQQEASVVAQIGFGKAAKDNLPFLIQGADAMRHMMDEARKGSGVLSNEGVEAIDKLVDSWTLAWAQMEGRAAKGILDTAGFFSRFDAYFKTTAFYKAFSSGSGSVDAFTGESLNTLTSNFGAKGDKLQTSNTGAKANKFTVIPDTAAIAKAIADAEKQAAAVKRVKDAILEEKEAITLSNLQQEINARLRDANVTAMSAEGQAIAKLVTAQFDLQRSYDEAIRAGEKWKEMQEAFQDLGQIGVDALWSWADGAASAKESLRDLTMQLAKLAIQAAIFGTGPFATLFGGGDSASGGILSSLTAALSSALLPARAGGGPVSAGKPYMVGERGRELFVPSQSGRIVSNGATGASGGVTINNYGAHISQQRTGLNGKDIVLTIKTINESDFAKNLNRHAPLIGGRPISKRTS